MIKLEHQVLPSPEQMEFVIEGMRNPKNSWGNSDSYCTYIVDSETLEEKKFEWFQGEKDKKRMDVLSKGGPVHRKYMRMMPVYIRITAPLYWWKEFDTYKVGTVANSCSTMHKIQDREFTLEDFSCEHLWPDEIEVLEDTINLLNKRRAYYNEYDNLYDKEKLEYTKKDIWWQMIQLLPSSYNQTRNVMLNYETLAAMYEWRHDHKLDEWREFCQWIETLPYSEIITGKFDA